MGELRIFVTRLEWIRHYEKEVRHWTKRIKNSDPFLNRDVFIYYLRDAKERLRDLKARANR